MHVLRTGIPRQSPDVVRWRQRHLEARGFDAELAATLAANPSWDLHAVLELVERGCPPPLAVRILAPDQIGATL